MRLPSSAERAEKSFTIDNFIRFLCSNDARAHANHVLWILANNLLSDSLRRPHACMKLFAVRWKREMSVWRWFCARLFRFGPVSFGRMYGVTFIHLLLARTGYHRLHIEHTYLFAKAKENSSFSYVSFNVFILSSIPRQLIQFRRSQSQMEWFRWIWMLCDGGGGYGRYKVRSYNIHSNTWHMPCRSRTISHFNKCRMRARAHASVKQSQSEWRWVRAN